MNTILVILHLASGLELKENHLGNAGFCHLQYRIKAGEPRGIQIVIYSSR